MDAFAQALTSACQAEILTFGEEVTFRGVIFKAIVGTSREVKAMEAAGYLNNEGATLMILPALSVGLAEDPKVNEIIRFRDTNWRIHQIETLEFGHALNLTVEKIR